MIYSFNVLYDINTKGKYIAQMIYILIKDDCTTFFNLYKTRLDHNVCRLSFNLGFYSNLCSLPISFFCFITLSLQIFQIES